ncbi:hypothetical protein JHK86_043201 [Glycine max]|nr:hypothetical protein JHK86_043201 [Glycine max]
MMLGTKRFLNYNNCLPKVLRDEGIVSKCTLKLVALGKLTVVDSTSPLSGRLALGCCDLWASHRFHPWLSSLCNAKSLITTRLFSSYYSLEQFSDDEYDCDFENQQASSTVANVDDWKWKLSMLLRSKNDQEIVSRDIGHEYLDRLQLNSAKTTDSLDDLNSTNQVKDIDMDENADSFVDESVMEKVLQKRSLRMRNMQRAWQESPEGRKMLEFRKSLPSFKEKQGLLEAIAHNQVIVVSGEAGCGKITQLPQYVLESEIESGRGAFCSIICTQPRRISVMAVAERVSAERGEPLGETDLLPRCRDLRLVLMSATLNAELFSNYFGEKLWKTQKQLAPRKRKNQIAALVECLPSTIHRVSAQPTWMDARAVGHDGMLSNCKIWDLNPTHNGNMSFWCGVYTLQLQ